MKILLVAPLHWPNIWEKQKADELVKYGEIRNYFAMGQGQYFWCNAFKNLGHFVEISRYSDPTVFSPLTNLCKRLANRLRYLGPLLFKVLKTPDLIIRNRRIIDKAKKIQPNAIIISGGGGIIWSNTIRALKQLTKAKLGYINGTSPVMFAVDELKIAAPYFDCIFTNDYYHSIQWLELGARKAISLPVSACDPSWHYPYRLTKDETHEYSSDVCFLGSLSPKRWYSERIRYLEAVSDFNLRIWTDDKEVLSGNSKLYKAYRGSAYGIRMLKILGSAKIALNFHGQTMQSGGNMRTFEIPATGTFQLIDRYAPEWFEEGKEVVSFKDVNDLREKIQYYLNNDVLRETIAKKGQQKVYNKHTYEIRMKNLIETLMS